MALVLTTLRAAVIAAGLRSALLAPAGAALIVAMLQCIGWRLPQSPWQVPDYWRRTLDRDALPVAYGAILGAGVFTAVVVGAFWVFVAATLIYTAPIALVGWTAYAVGRVVGFRVALQVEPLERLFVSARQRRALVAVTTIIAVVVVVT